MLQLRFFLLIALALSLFPNVFGQGKIELDIVNRKKLNTKPSFRYYHKDSLTAIKYLEGLNRYYQDKGYLLCNYEIQETVNSKWKVKINTFEKFQWTS